MSASLGQLARDIFVLLTRKRRFIPYKGNRVNLDWSMIFSLFNTLLYAKYITVFFTLCILKISSIIVPIFEESEEYICPGSFFIFYSDRF